MKIASLFESKSGKGYGSLQLTSPGVLAIQQSLAKLGIKNTIKDFHVTTIYDRSNPTIDIKLDGNKSYNATVSGVKLLGEPGTKWYAVALTLTAPEIVKLHKSYIEAGFKHSYPEFIAHVSLKYSPTESDIDTIKKSIAEFKKLKLIFSNESIEEIKD